MPKGLEYSKEVAGRRVSDDCWDQIIFFLYGMATSIFIVGTFNFILAKFCYVAIQLDILSENSYEIAAQIALEAVIRTVEIILEATKDHNL